MRLLPALIVVHLTLVRAWLVSFRVSVYVSVAPADGELTIDGFVHIFSIAVMAAGGKQAMRARVFVREDLLPAEAFE